MFGIIKWHSFHFTATLFSGNDFVSLYVLFLRNLNLFISTENQVPGSLSHTVAFLLIPSHLSHPPLTSSMGLRLNDLTDAPRAHAVFGSQLDFVPGSTAKVVQPEGTFTGADEHIPPFLCVVH